MKILSWNITQCGSKSSSESTWDDAENEKRIINYILSKKPELVSLQETPGAAWASEKFKDYTQVFEEQSHCGYSVLLVKTELKLKSDTNIYPTHFELNDVAFVCVHLAPSSHGRESRFEQMCTIAETLNSYEKCVVIGDTNMRAIEDRDVENLGFTDAWKQVGSNYEDKFTWNSRINHYHENGFEFTARFDRAYIKGVNCSSFSLIGNEKDNGAYLSDHFGIMIIIDSPN